jgi:hypothetical protein
MDNRPRGRAAARKRTKHEHGGRDRLSSASIAIVTQACTLAGTPGFEARIRQELEAHGITNAVRRHSTRRLVDWSLAVTSYQGVSNHAADSYVAAHGQVRYRDIAHALARSDSPCPKLAGIDAFVGCGYRKLARTCAHPALLPACPLPRHDLRNGRLNQLAYGLYFFVRDRCGGDPVGWLDATLAAADCPGHPDRLARLRAAIIPPLRAVAGIGDKVARLVLAELLIGADPDRERWRACGRSIVVVDTLVHAFLHRTGILARHHACHGYGSACYGPWGCAALLERLARAIDVRAFDPSLPAYHPRYVQHAVWRYGAAEGLDVCNGHRIDDRQRCGNGDCALYELCDRVALRPVLPTATELGHDPAVA